ncbi:Holliday junction resolvase RuvX [Aquitalea sp. S1-19]|uniref:Putative pre-16S rRNA nuclease n=1 Tax=Craterilacuibacter sinensis TaxID=2686017 RepID=A0A845BJ58_9NEIS|nr:Holliday junction resolvase RuvX [Craterilacuibacter sinensis]MCP9760714.1 Holliday junction resolvase RuvX [Aquitalea sp. S1-19]MXR35420.1 Holliday junction resolvase RuvX [Craterilacuibacter sinensis]RQW28670.1 Holliday junction resolvase RuvX [Rhodobacteraceae bacterium CH30]
MREELAGTVLGFDFGERRIGVALGETLLGIAHPLITIDTLVTDERFAAIANLLAEWKPVALIVGLPTHADGTPHNMTRLATKFSNRLKARYGLPVFLVDERYTSEVAESMLNDAGLRGRKQKPALDQVAAQAILQSWFEGVGERA